MSDNARLDIERRGLRCRLDDLSDHLDELKENKIDLVSRLNNKKKVSLELVNFGLFSIKFFFQFHPS